MTLEELQWMTELFRVGKMSKAAENLFVTQPALSQCVQRIEKQLGFKLFERSNKGLKPTPKGQLFYEAARSISKTYGKFLTEVELMDQQQIKEITVGMAPFLSYCCSVGMLSELRRQFPDVAFQVYEASTAELQEALADGRIQLAVIHELACRPEMCSHPFGKFHIGVFLRRGSPAEKLSYEEGGVRYFDPVNLAGEPISVPRRGQASRIISDRILQEAGIAPCVVAESGHVTTRYRYAQEGFASCIGPITGEAAALDKKQGKSIIYRIPPKYREASARFTVCAPPDVDKRIPKGIIPTIAECIMQNKDFVML